MAIRFSIVITTYNRLNLLKRAIDSALKQTVPCEVVIADDCSSDGTEEYVKNLCQSQLQQSDRRLIYHRNERNSGHSQTMNMGVSVASGEWIKPVDDDDYLAPNCIEEMAQAIAIHHTTITPETNSKAVICSAQAAQVDPNGRELSRTRIIGPGKAFYIPQSDIHYGMLLEQVPFGTPVQVAYRRDAFLKSGGWDSSLDVNFDDIDSWIKIAQFGDAIFINRCLAYRTVWPGAYNQKLSLEKRLRTNILIKEKIYPLIHQKHHHRLPDLAQIRNYLRLHWGLVALKAAKINPAFKMASSAVLSQKAWKILLLSMATRNQPKLSEVSFSELENNRSTVHPDVEADIHNPQQLKTYLKLRSGLTAVQRGKLNKAYKNLFPSLFSPANFKVFMNLLILENSKDIVTIQKHILIQ
ncbi:glycosyl transferase 2 family protein [Lyngbya aestuarii BL J]|uniref:Glycosyl transferase 2 family protein n=1 Tax=Lyngbya aestuarii BL J TaxID=1348334 RepID=U7QLM2_9CYAN|nr:glycosyl transferase 2 family protein [Lyngbya aestuarii BL J]